MGAVSIFSLCLVSHLCRHDVILTFSALRCNLTCNIPASDDAPSYSDIHQCHTLDMQLLVATTGSRCFKQNDTLRVNGLSPRGGAPVVSEPASFLSLVLLSSLLFVCVPVLAVCLLFTLKCSYAADSLLCRDNHSAEDADHQIVEEGVR